ncbi:C40 family peptidase [Georgenia sp. Z1344]|uniref:C40 family peptidase n=1 Tax=Georgenia sp. Z1344 TaxID=3416706 RepID=UPI003CF11D36
MQSTTRRTTLAAVSASIVVAVAASSASASPAPESAVDKTQGTFASVTDAVVPTNAALTVAADAAYDVETASVFGTADAAPAPEPEPAPEPVVREDEAATRDAEREQVAEEQAEVAEAPAADAPVAEQAPAEAPAVEAAPEPEAPAAAPSAAGSSIVAIARQYVGVPYVWGGTSPSGWDCSGFTSYVFAQAGISIPRSSAAQRGAGQVVSAAEARPGDLVWWPGHIGIYTGDGNHIAARNPGTPTHESPIYRANPTYIRVAG